MTTDRYDPAVEFDLDGTQPQFCCDCGGGHPEDRCPNSDSFLVSKAVEGANSLAETVEKLRGMSALLARMRADGYELVCPVRDGYVHLAKSTARRGSEG